MGAKVLENWVQSVAGGAVLLSVNQRLARHFNSRYQSIQSAGDALWWETPSILPIRAWLHQLHDEALAQGVSSRVRLPELLRHRHWRRAIDADKRVQLLDTAAAAVAAEQAWQLSNAWHCVNDESQYLSDDQFAWQRWRRHYIDMCNEQSLLDDSMLADHLVELIRAGHLGDCLPSRICLAGFLRVTPQQQTFFDTLRAAGVRIESIPMSSPVVPDTRRYVDDSDELFGIARAVKVRLGDDMGQSLGVVIPELAKLRSEVTRAFDAVFFPGLSPQEIALTGRPYDISLGTPLNDQSVVRTALMLITLLIDELPARDMSALLVSPYLVGATAEASAREKLDRKLREQRVRRIGADDLLAQLSGGSKLAAALRDVLKKRRMKRTSPTEWARRFSRWLHGLGWPGSAYGSEEHQAIMAFNECLDELQMIDEGQVLSASQVLGELRDLSRNRVFQAETPPGVPIQIMGRLESHGIQFDALWIAGLDADQWPPSANPTPFLSIAAQKACGIPEASATTRLALAEDEFRLWCSSATNVMISCASQREGKELVSASLPDIGLINSDHAEEPLANFDDMNLVDLIRQSAQLTRVEDFFGPPLPRGSKARGGASLFQDQAKCPFRAFARHRLAIRPLEEAGLGLDPRQHGNLLHKAMEVFWADVRSQERLFAMDETECDEAVVSAIDEAIAEEKISSSMAALERPRLKRLILEWLTLSESKREPFTVLETEVAMEIEHGGVKMNVTLDRIDEIEGSRVVIDYKTGAGNTALPWGDERIENPQLPLYVLTDDSIRGASFAQVVRHNHAFKGIAEDDSKLPKVSVSVRGSEINDWAAWRNHWQNALDIVAKEVRDGLATVQPMKNACDYCDLKPLCRIDVDAEDPVNEDSHAQESVT